MIAGEIGYFGLADWFISEFTEAEQNYMISRYQPMGGGKNALVVGNITFSNENVVGFLTSLLTWFRSPSDKEIFQKVLRKLHEYIYPELFSTDDLPAPP